MAINTYTEDEKGRQIRPILGNTVKDGSGTWYFPLVDGDGKLVVSGGLSLTDLTTLLLDHLLAVADGTGVYPASVVNDTLFAKLFSKGDPAAITSFNNTTDSLEALADAIALAALAATALSTTQWTNARAAYLDNIAATAKGKIQSFTKAITSAANAGAVTQATVTTQAVKLKSVAVRANAAQTADLTSIAITCGAGNVVTLIDAVLGIRANIAATDQQVSWTGDVTLPAGATIVATLAGSGATAVNLQFDIDCEAITDGGYLA